MVVCIKNSGMLDLEPLVEKARSCMVLDRWSITRNIMWDTQ